MIVDSHQFGKDGANVLAAWRQFDAEQFLDGVVPCDLIRNGEYSSSGRR